MLSFREFRNSPLNEEARPKITYGMLNEERDPRQTIRYLMNLAKRPGTVAEGEAALAQAKNLAQKYGIDLKDYDAPTASAGAAPAPAPAPPPPPQKPPVDPYQSVLARFGWRREFNPFRTSSSYIHPHFDLDGHGIEIEPDGWSHRIYGGIRYTGTTLNDLLNHLRSNVH